MAKNQNRIRNRWELITCGLGGHVTYAPDDAALAARLRASTGLGEVWRCLRCGDFALGGPQGRGAPEDAPLIMRGKGVTSGHHHSRARGRTASPGVGVGAGRVGGVGVSRCAGSYPGDPG